MSDIATEKSILSGLMRMQDAIPSYRKVRYLWCIFGEATYRVQSSDNGTASTRPEANGIILSPLYSTMPF